MLLPRTHREFSARVGLIVAIVCAGGAPTAAEATGSGTSTAGYYTASTVFETGLPSAAVQNQMIDCFNTGTCAETGAAVLRYPMPCNGSGTSDCTGCYRIIGGAPIKIGDVAVVGGRPTCQPTNGQSQIMVFVGAEMHCQGGAATCTDGELRLSCEMRSIAGGAQFDQALIYDKECFGGRPHARRARVIASTGAPTFSPVPVTPCSAGYYGVNGGVNGETCNFCANGTYSDTQGATACTACVAPVPANANPGSLTWNSTGTRSSASDCKVATFTCASPYQANASAGTCDLPACSVAITTTAANSPSSAGGGNGSLSVSASGGQGTLTFTLSPGSQAPVTGSATATFSGLASGTWTIRVDDSGAANCHASTTVTLMDPNPGASPSPEPSPVASPCAATTQYQGYTAIPLPSRSDGSTYMYWVPDSSLGNANCGMSASCRNGHLEGGTYWPPESGAGYGRQNVSYATFKCVNGAWMQPTPPQGICMCRCSSLLYSSTWDDTGELQYGMCTADMPGGPGHGGTSAPFCGTKGTAFRQGAGMVPYPAVPANPNMIDTTCPTAGVGGGIPDP